jgi:hypothetical protein
MFLRTSKKNRIISTNVEAVIDPFISLKVGAQNWIFQKSGRVSFVT